MEIVKKEELENVMYQNNMMASQAIIYKCNYNGKSYIYKKIPYYFYPKEMVELYKKLSYIHNKNLILPKFLVSSGDYIIGYLTHFIDFPILTDLQDTNIKEKIIIIKCVKEAILSMHKSGIIHCDLHTANIMYKDGQTKIIDFDSCVYDNNKPYSLNAYAEDYLKTNDISPSLDIFMFNISTISFLYNIAFFDVFDFDFVCNLDKDQEKIWQKTKSKKELTYNDFLINYY